MTNAIKHIDEYEDLFRTKILSNWAHQGWNAESGFNVERLDRQLSAIDIGYQRLVVCARMLFVFSQAHRMWGHALHAERAHDLFRRLTSNFADREFGGFYKTLSADGDPQDRRKDFYGHAFVLFALATYGGIFGNKNAITIARSTNDLIKNKIKLPTGWYATDRTENWQETGAALDQNPHMHLLEAYIALYRETNEPAFLADAEALAAFAAKHLIHRDHRVIPETVDGDGHAYADTDLILEPGHQFEWCWILHQLAGISGDDKYRTLADPLFDWANRVGVDGDYGGIYNKVRFDGQLIDAQKRIWPVTECIKAWAVNAQRTGGDAARAALSGWLRFLLDVYLQKDGQWHEYVDRDLKPLTDYMPGTTPYHLLMALIEAKKAASSAG